MQHVWKDVPRLICLLSLLGDVVRRRKGQPIVGRPVPLITTASTLMLVLNTDAEFF